MLVVGIALQGASQMVNVGARNAKGTIVGMIMAGMVRIKRLELKRKTGFPVLPVAIYRTSIVEKFLDRILIQNVAAKKHVIGLILIFAEHNRN